MSDEPRNCTCDEWEMGMNEIEATQTLAWTHGMLYTAPPFRFCPWCGKELLKTGAKGANDDT